MQETPKFNLRHEGGVAIVTLLERKILGEVEVQRLGEQLYALVDQEGCKKILISFRQVQYLSSEANGKLITLNKKLNRADGRLILCEINPQIFEMFELTKLNKLFDIQKSEADGLNVLRDS